MESSHISALRRAIDIFGSQAALASALGISRVAVGQWLKPAEDPAARKVSPRQCLRIERLTQAAVTRCELRPNDWTEFWPELANSKPKQPPAQSSPALAATETVAQAVAHD